MSKSSVAVVTSFVALAFLVPDQASACSWKQPGKCVKKAVEVVVIATTPSVAVDVVTGKKPGETAKKVTQEGSNLTKHVGAEGGRAIGNVSEAGLAIARYAENVLKGYGDTLSDAERRIRDGKLIDAFWHLGTDPHKHQENAAAKAAQESSLIRTAMATAASAYGGPGGSAAFASWYAYRASGGDAEAALRAGLVVGATSLATGAAGKMKADTLPLATKKAILTGAIGGMAVAAAGGDKEAVEKGFLLAGGMVLVQSLYEAQGTPLNPKAAVGDPYCMAAVPVSVGPMPECAPNFDAYERDAQGNVLLQEDGLPKVDVRKTNQLRPHVGTWAKPGEKGWLQETGAPMRTLAQVPGMNTMSVFHDHWSVSWSMDAFTNKATIVPAVVLTYIGTGSPLDVHLADVATARARAEAASTGRADGQVQPEAIASPDILNGLRFTGGADAARGVVRPVSLWLELPDAKRRAIRKLHYEFEHPTFKSPKRPEDGSNIFMTKWRGYGCIQSASVVLEDVSGSELKVPFNLCDLWNDGVIDGQ